MSSSSTLESSAAAMTSGVGSTAATSSNSSSNSSNSSNSLFPSIVELNVGGVFYTTALSTLTRDGESLLAQMFTGRSREPVLRDSKGKYFIDRDGVLFRYTLDYLRDGTLTLPHNFHERDRLKQEADFFQLATFSRWLASPASGAFPHQNNPESGKCAQLIDMPISFTIKTDFQLQISMKVYWNGSSILDIILTQSLRLPSLILY